MKRYCLLLTDKLGAQNKSESTKKGHRVFKVKFRCSIKNSELCSRFVDALILARVVPIRKGTNINLKCNMADVPRVRKWSME